MSMWPAAGRKLGLKVEFVTSEWASILAGLAANKYDVIISQVGINPKREQALTSPNRISIRCRS
jgi:ABC-type amino acid transport substrate-binding protein